MRIERTGLSSLSENEYLKVDEETFRKRVSQNKQKFRAKLKELNEAKKVYLELLSFS